MPELIRTGALLLEAEDAAGRKQMQQWFKKTDFTGQLFVLDPEASGTQVEEWLAAGATDVFDSDEYAVSAVEELMAAPSGTPRLIGNSRKLQAVREKVQLVAARRCSVLIEGETGTGKEVIARSIHLESERRSGPWVTVNCAAIPESLLEAELFGHVKGAFTGAVQSRVGKFEAANRGTIFLDEIGDMPISVQGKLLRVLQEKEVERLGGNDRVRLDVRVIAATNARLEELVRQGKFRQDLFYRLNVVRIEIAPLRERSEDISLLARKFIQRTCSAEGIPTRHLSPAASLLLLEHSWPGNVRELENSIESAVILSGERRVLEAGDFDLGETQAPKRDFQPQVVELPIGGLAYQKALEDFERNLLTQALTRVRGNKTAAAELLGMKRTTLTAKLRTLESRMPRLVA